MKKILISVLFLIIIVALDVLFFKLFPFYVKPNLFLGYVVFLALFFSHTETVIWSFLIGVILDFIYLKVFGINSIAFLITGYTIGWLNKRVDESIRRVQIIILFLASFLYFLSYFIFSLILNIPIRIFPLFFLNTISTVFFSYFLLQVLIYLYKLNKLID